MLLNKETINKIINSISKAKNAIDGLIHNKDAGKAGIGSFSFENSDSFSTYLRKGLVCALAAAVVTVLGFGTFSSANLCFGSEVIVNGRSIALVDDQDDFEETLSYAKQFVSAVSNQVVEFDVTYVPRVIREASITSDEEILQKLYSQCNGMVPGCALYVEGELVAAASDAEIANQALDALKDRYQDANIEDLKVSFDKEVELKEEYVPAQMIMSAESIAAVLTGDRTHYGYYTVAAADTLSTIAAKLNVRESSLEYLNGVALYEGKVISYQHKDTILKVMAEYTQTESAVIPYETERVSSNDLKKGNSKVKTRGADGEKLVTTKIVMLNGEEVRRAVVEEQVITPAKNEVILIGSNAASGKTIVASASGSTGYFLWPNRGKLSSRFGNRSRDNHKGIDISSPTGSHIYAADGGTVTFAGWDDGGYGYMVVIDHGNGYITYYAHCNEVLVNEGDRVSQGDLIAYVGNTGLSTGPHLHFEVRLNGTPVNPLNYMDE